ncbi:MAG: glycosyltransferase, partial [Acidobacteria bacterium]|nr:glycosyltransferase [Acidobacteriota bacterium]
MTVLVASFYGDPRLANAPAQFTRALTSALDREGIETAVWTGVSAPASAPPFRLRGTEVPVTVVPTPDRRRWLGDWLPHPELRQFALRELSRLRPEAVVLSAWRGLSDVALAARDLGLPTVLFLHDYSILCLRSWLLDAEGRLCKGPDTDSKCVGCFERALGRRGRLRHTLCALPLAGAPIARSFGRTPGDHLTVAGTVREAREHMARILDSARLVVAQTPRARQILERQGVAAERIELVPQSLSPDKRLGRNREERPSDRPLRFVFLGRWSAEKGGDLLAEAFQAARLPEGTELWVIASNPETAALPPVHPTSGKRLRLFAGFSGAETSYLLARTDLCIVPSRCEDLASRATLEAMEQGVPVVASDSVGNAYLIEDGVNGRIFPTGSAEALRDALEGVAWKPEVISQWGSNLPKLPSPEEFG